jgi:hypothetical protein
MGLELKGLAGQAPELAIFINSSISLTKESVGLSMRRLQILPG